MLADHIVAAIEHVFKIVILLQRVRRMLAVGIRAGVGGQFARRHLQGDLYVGGEHLVAQGRAGVKMRFFAGVLRRAPDADQHQNAEEKRQGLLHASHFVHFSFLCILRYRQTYFSTL